jgi:MerR family transcriptional regulator, heat shock protein HspR
VAQKDKEEPVYMISIAARLCEMHPQTLRLYERAGLIKPYRVSRKNRMYSDADIERLRQIQRLTHELGVNLAGVEVILRLLDQMEQMRAHMEEEINRIQSEMDERMREMQEDQ